MKKIPNEEKLKRFYSISGALQEAMISEKSAATIGKAAVFANIEKRVSLLAWLTGHVLLGYLNPVDFPKELQEELDVSEEVAEQITSQLDAEIFSLVEADLRKLYPPTIKTPTVHTRGFTQEEVDKTVKEKEEAEKIYVGAFEKRFLKKQTGPSFESKTSTTPPKATIPETNKSKVKESESAPSKTEPVTEKAQKRETIPEKREKKELPKIKPVVPLSTFIQSQFQPREKDQQRNAQYKEAVPKEKTEQGGERKPPAPKLKGNVIDLRDL